MQGDQVSDEIDWAKYLYMPKMQPKSMSETQDALGS